MHAIRRALSFQWFCCCCVAFMLCNEHRDIFFLCQPNFIQLGYLYFTSCKQCNELNPNQPGGWNFKNVAVQLLLVSIATNGFFFVKKLFLFEFLLNNQFSYFVNSSAFYLCVTAKLLSMGPHYKAQHIKLCILFHVIDYLLVLSWITMLPAPIIYPYIMYNTPVTLCTVREKKKYFYHYTDIRV